MAASNQSRWLRVEFSFPTKKKNLLCVFLFTHTAACRILALVEVQSPVT